MCYFLCAVNWTDCYSTAYNSLSHNNTKASIVKHFTIYITASPHSCTMYSLFMTSCPCGLKEKRKEKGKFDGFQGSLQNPSKVRSNLKLNTTLYLHKCGWCTFLGILGKATRLTTISNKNTAGSSNLS